MKLGDWVHSTVDENQICYSIKKIRLHVCRSHCKRKLIGQMGALRVQCTLNCTECFKLLWSYLVDLGHFSLFFQIYKKLCDCTNGDHFWNHSSITQLLCNSGWTRKLEFFVIADWVLNCVDGWLLNCEISWWIMKILEQTLDKSQLFQKSLIMTTNEWMSGHLCNWDDYSKKHKIISQLHSNFTIAVCLHSLDFNSENVRLI